MPRVCSLCHHPQRAEIDRALLAGTPLRTIADHWSASKTALIRHKPHIAQSIAVVERETGLSTIRDVQHRMTALQARVEKLVSKLEKASDHRTTLAGLRECREGLKAIAEVLVTSDLERRLRALEGGEADEGSTENAA